MLDAAALRDLEARIVQAAQTKDASQLPSWLQPIVERGLQKVLFGAEAGGETPPAPAPAGGNAS